MQYVGTRVLICVSGEATVCNGSSAKQAAKRVGLRFTPTRTASWDHRKLAGTY